MIGNGLANVAAATILAGAVVWAGGLDDRFNAGGKPLTEKEIAEIYARAVGDIRNDIVVNCGCCGEGEGQRRAEAAPF